MDLNFCRYCHHIASSTRLDLGDAPYPARIVQNIVERYQKNDDFKPDNDDFMALSNIIMITTETLTAATSLEAVLRRRTDIGKL